MKSIIKDPYSLDAHGGEFGDYFNEIFDIISSINSGFSEKKILKMIQKKPLKEVEARFSKYYEGYPTTKEAVENHPTKVAHINHMAKLANACTTIPSLKPILNEIFRLIYGKTKELPFPETEFDPELVNIKE